MRVRSFFAVLLLMVAGLQTVFAQKMIVRMRDSQTVEFNILQVEDVIFVEDGQAINVPTKGLVAYYPFNGNANDESGNGNDGTPMESVTLTTGVHGDANGAYQFGGTDNPGNIHVPNSESLQIGEEWSFAAYIKPLSIAGMTGWGTPGDMGRFCIMGKSHDQHGVAIDYEYQTEESLNVDMTSWGWDEVEATDETGSHLGKWTHVAVVKSGNSYKVFVNGEMLYEGETEHDYSLANGEDMYFGKYDDDWYPMNGIMDEVCIYNRALTASEVKQMAKYAEASISDDVPTKGLVAYYPFNGNANDESGNGYHATPCNSYRYEDGIVGGCISVEGQGYCTSAGGHVLLPEFDFNASSGITLSLWVKALGLSDTDGECYISIGDHSSGHMVFIQQEPSTIYFNYHDTKVTIPYLEDYTGNWVMYIRNCPLP